VEVFHKLEKKPHGSTWDQCTTYCANKSLHARGLKNQAVILKSGEGCTVERHENGL
jgi:hypothetical protein